MKRLGMVARWKPVHLGHAAVLRGLCRAAEHVEIGIGSSNKYDADNPFTPAETAEMIRLVLVGRHNFTLHEIPDLGDPPRWARMVADRFGPLDAYATANGQVRDCMLPYVPVIHPVTLVPPEERVRIDGTMVRAAMREGRDWAALVPPEIAAYLRGRGLVERYLREFPPPAAP